MNIWFHTNFNIVKSNTLFELGTAIIHHLGHEVPNITLILTPDNLITVTDMLPAVGQPNLPDNQQLEVASPTPTPLSSHPHTDTTTHTTHTLLSIINPLEHKE